MKDVMKKRKAFKRINEGVFRKRRPLPFKCKKWTLERFIKASCVESGALDVSGEAEGQKEGLCQ